MSILRSFNLANNCEDVVYRLIRELNVNATFTTVREKLLNHPYYPSMASIGDTLNFLGIDNISVRLNLEEALLLSTPFIAHIKGRKSSQDYFALVEKVSEGTISFYNPETYKVENETIDFFKKIYNNIILIAEPGVNAGEENYKESIKKEKKEKLIRYVQILTIPALLSISIIYNFLTNTDDFATKIHYLLLALSSLGGAAIGSILVWHEIDQYNPVIRKICRKEVNKKTNCSAILNSKASKIFGLSWASIGFSYFIGIVLILLFYSNDILSLTALGLISAIALTYVVFSIFYQWRIARQWCILCVGIQSILVMQFIAFLFSELSLQLLLKSASFSFYIGFTTCFFIPLMAITVLIPQFKKSKQNGSLNTRYQRLKNDPLIFSTFLHHEKTVTIATEGLGITLGNPTARHKIIKVCNPYCGPCAASHKELESVLMNNENVQLQIIFTATGKDGDIKNLPVQHFLAIAMKNSNGQLKAALNDWYNSPVKNYDVFAKKYQIPEEEINAQKKKVEDMNNWCDRMQIAFTPTIFVDGHQLPEMYDIEEIKYFL